MKNIIKLFGYGIIIWVVAFMVATVFVAMETGTGLMADIVVAVAAAITAFLLARSLNVSSVAGLLKYAISWLFVGVILDVLITIQFTGWEFFQRWEIYASYGITFLAVLVGVKKPQMMS